MLINPKSSVHLAITCQSLFLANLLFLPGLSFIALIWLLFKYKRQSAWLRIHLYRAVQLSVAVGLVVFTPLIFILLSDKVPFQLMAMLLYFILVHTGFVLIGMLNLARAMVKKLPIF
ncbi:hypothetical protein RGQ13_01190 [Thalassotalea psychrophila]|uniref:Orphan protein n=1 Tax=Thalassotalea psychrophila TaxID=3065647 RepID=A0ABY9TXW5_9GAMM|nr:hypothetical protein RGQ13_01190 [Colwelliaceae bacterium SQ149]